MRRSSAAWSTIADFYTAFGESLLMTALGQKQTLGKVRLMSALSPKADVDQCHLELGFRAKK